METIEFKKVYKPYYSPKPQKPEILDIPKMQFVAVDGAGDPDSQRFQDAIGALYSTVYGLKFSRKKLGKSPDFTIGALEGLWWTSSGKQFEKGKKEDWLWTMMIWVPDFITKSDITGIVKEMAVKKPNPALEKIRLESYKEGQVVQIMHIGPYDSEQPNIELMHDYAREQGYTQSGKHHEIYLGDPRRAKPEKLKTILRHQIKKI